jgi:hypothetical protein
MQNQFTPNQVESELSTVNYLRSTQAIRDRCGQLFELCLHDQLHYFRCDLTQLDAVADYVIQVIQDKYPDWQIPFHSRWRHFQAGSLQAGSQVGRQVGGIDRLAALDHQLIGVEPLERARIKFDLVITSVLLDAGAGAQWRYREANSGQVFQRSEGLAVASYHLFLDSGFSSVPQTLQADAVGLQNLSLERLANGFQVSEQNPLVGLAGRLQLMHQLGLALTKHPDLFGTEPRLGGLVDYLIVQADEGKLSAHQVFEAVLTGFSDIWPGRTTMAQINLGDVWLHAGLPHTGPGSQLVPFHKLSQWLTYSLLEPLQALGLEITELDRLTGLAEYRNGGLMIDLGLLQPKADLCSQPYHPADQVIVEWRALTLVLLDQIAAKIRQKLNLSSNDLPLAKILEGGTWAAGRRIAAEKRADGAPPIQIISDGTVF